MRPCDFWDLTLGEMVCIFNAYHEANSTDETPMDENEFNSLLLKDEANRQRAINGD